ncbi:MAG: alcohol dehydrogenase class IV, partial [Gammaproteobacteria bacterium]
MWKFENPVEISFGNGAFDTVGDLIGDRPFCLVTYNEPYFDDLSTKLIDLAGKPASVINNITPNPNFITLTESCAQFSDTAEDGMVIIALGGGSVIDAAKVLAS